MDCNACALSEITKRYEGSQPRNLNNCQRWNTKLLYKLNCIFVLPIQWVQRGLKQRKHIKLGQSQDSVSLVDNSRIVSWPIANRDPVGTQITVNALGWLISHITDKVRLKAGGQKVIDTVPSPRSCYQVWWLTSPSHTTVLLSNPIFLFKSSPPWHQC